MLLTVCRSADITLNDDGAQLFAQALDEAACGRLETALAALPTSRPGVRIGEGRQLQPFLNAAGPIGAIAASVLGKQVRPVRAILFDKTAERNWALGWHQDRMIVVKEHMDTARRNGCTQPAISQAIARLANVFGGDIFERRRGAPLTLTTIGEAVLPSARTLLDVVDKQLKIASGAAQGQTGSVSLGFSPGLAVGPLRAAMTAFVEERPDVQLRLVEGSARRPTIDVRYVVRDLLRLSDQQARAIDRLLDAGPRVGRQRREVACVVDQPLRLVLLAGN